MVAMPYANGNAPVIVFYHLKLFWMLFCSPNNNLNATITHYSCWRWCLYALLLIFKSNG